LAPKSVIEAGLPLPESGPHANWVTSRGCAMSGHPAAVRSSIGT
jgi:hypothetical protein